MAWVFDVLSLYLDEAIVGAFFAVICSLGMYTLVQALFKRVTAHRGAFHSIPMAMIFGLVVVSALIPYKMKSTAIAALSMSVVVGYLCHLLLDELNSAVNLDGKPFRPKKSLGTAMKLTASTSLTTAFMYMTLSGLLFFNQKFLLAIL